MLSAPPRRNSGANNAQARASYGMIAPSGLSAGTVQGELARPQRLTSAVDTRLTPRRVTRQQASLRVPHSDSGPCGGLSQCIPVSSTEKIPRLSLTRSTATYALRTERCTVHSTLEQPAPAHAL